MAYLDPVIRFGDSYYGQPVMQSGAPLSSARSFARRFPALANDMILHYQPIVRSSDAAVTAVEALVRFPRADGSLRPTLSTVRRIYDEHQGFAFDRRVVAAAVAQNMTWLEHGIDVAVHVNVSATTIESTPGEAFGDWLAESCYATPRLTIEVTERDTFLDASRAGDFVASCRRRGIEVAIDDFGCGYSTFELLSNLTADIVKIDWQFTRRLMTCVRTQKIVVGLIELAHALEMRVVAEGVEDAEQCSWLRAAGCDELQGYFIARPMAGDAYMAWHRDHT